MIEQLALYTAEHGAFRLDSEGRALRHTLVAADAAEDVWKVEQMLQDHNDLNDWCGDFTVDLAASRAASSVVLRFEGFRAV